MRERKNGMEGIMKITLRLTEIVFSIILSVLSLVLVSLSGCTKEGPAGPRGETGSNNLMDPSVRPEIVSSVPANNAMGPFELFAPGPGKYLPHFILEFNKLINTSQFPPGAVTVSGFRRPVYVRPYSYYIYRNDKRNGTTSLSNGPFDNIVGFAIYDSATGATAIYDIGKTYTVTIDTSLYDINGNHPELPTSFSFTPEPGFRLVGVSPTNGSINVDRNTQPFLYFNAPIDQSTLSHLHLSPTVDGIWGLFIFDSDSVTAILTLLHPYGFHTQYTLSVDGGATDAAGDHILAPSQSIFTTSTFSITYTYPSNGSAMVDPIVQIQLNFSDPADTGSIRTAFSMSPATAGSLYCYSSYCYFYPAGTLIPNTQYTVTLSTALKSAEGFHLESPYVLRFTTAPFRITSTYPSDHSIDVSRSSYCYIYCNMVIDTGSVRSAFHISPATPGILQLYTASNQFTFAPLTGLDSSTVYTVSIDSTFRSFNGYTMASPYKFSFTTGPY